MVWRLHIELSRSRLALSVYIVKESSDKTSEYRNWPVKTSDIARWNSLQFIFQQFAAVVLPTKGNIYQSRAVLSCLKISSWLVRSLVNTKSGGILLYIVFQI